MSAAVHRENGVVLAAKRLVPRKWQHLDSIIQEAEIMKALPKHVSLVFYVLLFMNLNYRYVTTYRLPLQSLPKCFTKRAQTIPSNGFISS